MASEYLNNKTFERMIGKFQQSKKGKARYELFIKDLEDTLERKTGREICLKKEETKLAEIFDIYKDIKIDYHAAQKELATAFYVLAENIVRFAKFNLIEDDDAIQEGVMICFDKIDRFDPRKGKAFNYMTTCVLNHFRQLYRTSRSFHEFKKKYHDFLQLKLHSSIFRNGKEVYQYQSSLNRQI